MLQLTGNEAARQGYNKYQEGIPFPLICQLKMAEVDNYKSRSHNSLLMLYNTLNILSQVLLYQCQWNMWIFCINELNKMYIYEGTTGSSPRRSRILPGNVRGKDEQLQNCSVSVTRDVLSQPSRVEHSHWSRFSRYSALIGWTWSMP